MSTQRSQNKTNRLERNNNTDWLDKVINELSKNEAAEFKSICL